jgi:hypothetical protein
MSISSIGLVMPACFHSAAAASREACGFTWSRSAAEVASERITVPWIHAGLGEDAATSSAAITSAQAPSEDGQVSSYRIGSQSICEASTDSTVVSGFLRCA